MLKLFIFAFTLICIHAAEIQPNPHQTCPSDIPDSRVSCLNSCEGIANGDYHSCINCNVYVTCSNGVMYDNRPCPSDLVWNDAKKICDYRSNTKCELSGRLSVDLSKNDYGQKYLNEGGMFNDHKRWRLMRHSPTKATDFPSNVNCNTPLIYQFTPPKCLKKLTFRFESAGSKRMSVSIVDMKDISKSEKLVSLFAISQFQGYKLHLSKSFSNVFIGNSPGSPFCGEIRKNLVSYSGSKENKTIITSNSQQKLFDTLGSRTISFLMNIDAIAFRIRDTHACKFDVHWEC